MCSLQLQVQPFKRLEDDLHLYKMQEVSESPIVHALCEAQEEPTADRNIVLLNDTKSKTSNGFSKLEASSESKKNSFVLAAVSENRFREIGIAVIDLVTPFEISLWNIIDSPHYVESVSLLEILQPAEILVAESLNNQRINGQIASRLAPSMSKIVPLARKYFDQTKGADDLRRVMVNCADLYIARDYVVMAALACLIRYVEYIQGVHLAENSIKVVVNAASERLVMDYSTVRGLELLQSNRGNSSKETLFGLVNSTKTTAGSRLLRSTMLQPPCHLETIFARQEVVSTFLENPGWYFEVSEQLPNFASADRVLSQLVMIPKVITPRVSQAAIANVIGLKRVLDSLPLLAFCLQDKLQSIEHPPTLLSSILQSIQSDHFKTIKQEISRVIHERVILTKSSAQRKIQECFAVRAGIHGMLDVARRTYQDTIEEIYQCAREYDKKLEHPAQLVYTNKRGYHLKISSESKSLSSVFIECVVSKKVILCTTRELSCLNDRLRESLVAVYKLSNEVMQTLLNLVRPYASDLYSMVESIALLDMLLSFTHMVAVSPTTSPYNRPSISEHGNLVIKQGRHPLVERTLKDRHYVASDSYFDPLSTYHVITGPNCAGKSTYLKSVAVITILSHMGCYVPAVAAFIPLRDRICTRFGTSDDMGENASTFRVEMTETAYILERATKTSLVLMDEVGRGTSTDEGSALAWSISEVLIGRGTYTCFATHYSQLNELSELYPNCNCCYLMVSVTTNDMLNLHVMKDGPFPDFPMYGIKTASACGIPKQIITEAESIYMRLRQEAIYSPKMHSDSNKFSHLALLHHIIALGYAGLDKMALRKQLQSLRESGGN